MGEISRYSENTNPATGDFVLGETTSGPTTNRFKLLNLITLFNNNVGQFTDYSSSSTIVGWSSLSTTIIQYAQVGKVVFVNFALRGTSNSTAASFTLPVAAVAINGGANTLSFDTASGLNFDNGSIQSTPARIYIDPTVSDSLVTLVRSMGVNSWTASGTKDVRGMFSYQA